MQNESPRFLVGTGGWAYFNVSRTPSLMAYSRVFNFTEVNYTFYEYPEFRRVEQWRRIVPADFVFSVRCHQDLTHRIGLKPVAKAYNVIDRMLSYCELLQAPYLVVSTPPRYRLDEKAVDEARDFFSSLRLGEVRLIWEIRATVAPRAVELMRDLNIVHCADLSKDEPALASDVVYSRLFGKGEHNIYQFTDEELKEIDQKASLGSSKTTVLSFHGLKMNTDAVRFLKYKNTGKFVPATLSTGIDSIKAVLSEDAHFPISKSNLVIHQGWKVVDVTLDKRVRLSELLTKLPEKTFNNIDEVASSIEEFF
jgi:uncharacterized protein YecE (DUF72 family)